MNKKIPFFIIVILTAVLVISCGTNRKDDPNYIKVGVQVGPEFTVAQEAQRIAKEKYGLEVELIEFNDYIMPNTALKEGDIDANVFQHKPFLEDQAKRRGYKFAVVGNTFIYPLAGYSKKTKSLDELQSESTIVIPNDATNGGRALLLLQKEGLIKLKDNVGYSPRVIDITENPKSLKIVELEAPLLSRMLDDSNVSIAIINNTFASLAGLTLDDSLFAEDKDSPYVNVIVTKEEDKDNDKIKRFVQAFQSEEVAKVAEKEFKGGAVKGW